MAAKKKAVKKSEKTTAKRTGHLGVVAKVPQPHGGALNAGGTPGNKGGTGRPPNWLKDWCDDILADPTSRSQVEEILKDKNHGAFATMWKAVSDRAHGKPKEHVQHDATESFTDLMAQAFGRAS